MLAEGYTIVGREIYLNYVNGRAVEEARAGAVRAQARGRMTARNLNTVTKLISLSTS